MNRNFLVTGGAQGIGFAICREILEKGGNVFLTDINSTLGEESKEKLAKEFGATRVGYGEQDVTNKEQWRTVWEGAEKFFGGRVDALVNNAGIFSKTAYDKVLDINLMGLAHGSMLAVEKMGTSRGGGGGLIVQISSGAGLLPIGANLEEASYTASKHGVIGFVKWMAKSENYLREKVRMVAICPSFVETKLVSNVASLESIKQKSGMDIMQPEEISSAFSKMVVNGNSGDCLVIIPGMKFLWPDPSRITMTQCAIISKILIKVFGHKKDEPITQQQIQRGQMVGLFLIAVIFHIFLSWIGF